MAQAVSSMWLKVLETTADWHSSSTRQVMVMFAPTHRPHASAYYRWIRLGDAFPHGYYFSCRSIDFRCL